MREKLLLMVAVASELALGGFFKEFRASHKFQFNLLVVYVFTALGLRRGNILRIGADWIMKGLRWMSAEEEDALDEQQSDKSKMTISMQRSSSLGIFDAIFTALAVRFAFMVIPWSLQILLTTLLSSYQFTLSLLSKILSFFDIAPLWLLVVAGAPILTFLAKASSLYLRWWLWLSFTALGGYAVGVFAGLSALLTLTTGTRRKRTLK
jgi:hypothetical protein